jgi:hypothetical protein
MYAGRGFYFVGAHPFTTPARPTSPSALGWHLKNQTTCLFGLRPPVAHVGVEDRPIYAPAYRTVACPSDMKLASGARRRMRTVSWCQVRGRQQQVREKNAFLDPTAIASPGRGRILAEALRQSGNCAVTNKTAASDSYFW